MSDEERRAPKSWPYDPAQLSYKEWIALPDDEQGEVLEILMQRSREPFLRDGPPRGEALKAQRVLAEKVAQEAREEQERTGRIARGWIVLGQGIIMHGLIRRLPPGMKWVESVPPRKPQCE